MEKQPTVAELRFASQGMSLYGTVMQMNAEEIKIRLHTVPVTRDLFARNNAVEIVVVARNTMFMAATTVRSEKDGALILSFSAPVRTIQRRREQRIPCQLDVNFRAIQDTGCFGLWKNAVSSDISSNGMCLIIPPGMDVPKKVEVLFKLPEQSAAESTPSMLCGDDGIEMLKMLAENRLELLHMPTRDRPVKAVARVTNRRQRSDGHITLGLCFTSLAPADQIRLASFLNSPRLASA